MTIMKTNEFEIVPGGSNDFDEGRKENVLLEKKIQRRT